MGHPGQLGGHVTVGAPSAFPPGVAVSEDLSSSTAVAFELPAPSLRVFHRAVSCLVKLGRDTAIILRAEELVLHGADDGHSSAMQFAFRRRFFRRTPANSSSAAAQALARGQEVRLVVGSRALINALKGAQQRTVDCLVIGLSAHDDGQQRLILEFAARFGGMVRHRVPLLDQQAFLPGEPGPAPHAAAMSANLLVACLDQCSPPSNRGGCEEVTLAAMPDEGLRIRSHDLLGSGGVPATGASSHGGKQSNKTEVALMMKDLHACNLGGQGAEAVFSGRGLREFAKAADACARDLETMNLLDGPVLLELRFGAEGGPIKCRMVVAVDGFVSGLQDFDAVLVVATRELIDDAGASAVAVTQPSAPQVPLGGSAVAATAASQSARRPQPKQGAKRRALATLPSAEAFDAFPDADPRGGSYSSQATPAAPSATPVVARAPAPGYTPAGVAPPQVKMEVKMEPLTQLRVPPQQPLLQPLAQQQSVMQQVLQPGQPQQSPQQFNHHVNAQQPLWHQSVQAVASQPPGHAGKSAAMEEDSVPATMPASAQALHVSAVPQQLRLQQPAPSMFGGGVQTVQQPPLQLRSDLPPPTLPSHLQALDTHGMEESDSELIGADPDEVADVPLGPRGEEDNVDWFDVAKLW